MKIFPRILLVSVLLASPALAANKFVAAGAPSPEREWLSQDYQTMADLLAAGKIAAPTMADPDGAAILRRMWSTENFAFHRNKSLPIGQRLPSLLAMQSSVQSLLSIYVKEANQGKKVGREMVESIAFTLRSSVLMLDLVDELVPTIAPDRREQAEAGLKQMRGGLVTVFNGAEVSLGERKLYSDADLSILLRAMSETLPAIKRAFDEDTILDLRARLQQRKAAFQNPSDVRALEKMLETLAAKPAPKSSGAKGTI